MSLTNDGRRLAAAWPSGHEGRIEHSQQIVQEIVHQNWIWQLRFCDFADQSSSDSPPHYPLSRYQDAIQTFVRP